ncbi:arrestin (or S-antigen), N-terminal domain protein [Aspergillus luchuensis]|uniref:Arrestin (Or S-antigen), N-terminal domain protein n=1 Tax=Aspergillus kawachii TaxID=1069201 RepID=A0A146EZG2_ASPKA|nr:arrestin (or S-antigen), N-terminal domain protein [Aspergillus luchuensis]
MYSLEKYRHNSNSEGYTNQSKVFIKKLHFMLASAAGARGGWVFDYERQ